MLIKELRLREQPAETLDIRCGRIKAKHTHMGHIRIEKRRDLERGSSLLLIRELVKLASQFATPRSHLHFHVSIKRSFN